ncbi:ATP-binding cassette domain-containing protein [Leifsonia sp. F6_8S_P_1B]|uniref:ATP-binding cassette domain-containing protein n=1 Tax=Leifsonia williamsii TaxID=3035919 RepID=A0ABT8KGQ7_9MICO|nr:ATP-binding cassette domain-containing protein [Leifsonia williamsii]MDN4616168.1 ATP-binding cassette domain-containing protein [Leifsonia williamsii]
MQITVAHASVRFGRRIVLHDFSAVFPTHRVTALTGPSGSGKSTLLSAMSGFTRLDSGRIAVGPGLDEPDPSLVAWVPQGSNALGARSARENVMMGALSRGVALSEAARLADEQLRILGLGERADTAAMLLSGGELQRVGFARALVSRRPIIFADEPSASLDEQNTKLLATVLHDLASVTTIVVATHDPLLVGAAQHQVSLRGRGG